MKTLTWSNLPATARRHALARPKGLSNIDVSSILESVRTKGDKALYDLTERFDGVQLPSLKVHISELEQAWTNLENTEKEAIKTAKANIEKFHSPQIPKPIRVNISPGIVCSREPRPLDSVGLYVPGGTAPLVSTLLMLAVPAQLAGVNKIIITTPPQSDGKIASSLLACAYLCDIEEIYCIGGAQAIAALAYGTETVPKTVKIFGPGNAYVSAAKAQVSAEIGGPAIDLPAGPSEVMVLADETANPTFVAADMLAQAEHDPLAQVLCICTSEVFANKISGAISQQLADLPRKNVASKALENSKIIITEKQSTMVQIVNEYAPEHLIIQMASPEDLLPKINNAGSIFLGPWTPESVGDYASGTNHTLPTYGAAKAYSGVVLESFMKFISIQTLTRQGLQSLGPTVEKLAQMEGLEAHRRAVTIRLASEDLS